MNTFRVRLYFLIFYFLVQGSIQQGDDNKRCRREIVESYNLNGYISQRPMNMYICPAVKMSCCSMYDQFMMFSTWKDKIKPKLMKYYDGIRKKYMDMKDMIETVFEIDMVKLINNLSVSDSQKETILNKLTIVKSQDSKKLFDDMLIMHHRNYVYMMKLRSAFFCTICDYDSQALIDLKNKIFPINDGTCTDIAQNTIEYSFYLNVKLSQYLQDFSEILANFGLSDADRPVRIKYFENIKRGVRSCARAVESGGNMKACKSYCRHFKFNANSPVIEGYQIFFNEILNAMTKFIKSYGPSSTSRVLEEETSKKRILQDESPFPTYTMKDIKSRKDPYDEDAIDPNFDDFVLNAMFNFNKDVEEDRQQGYINFVKTKIFNFDTEYDYENGDDSDIFKTSSNVIVDLENFSTRVTSPGIDFIKHAESTNIDNSMRELISHLKNKSKYKILYEKLDPPLLEQINNIDNELVKNFHRDNYLYFKDFSADLKKEEIIGNLIAQSKPSTSNSQAPGANGSSAPTPTGTSQMKRKIKKE